MLLKFLLILFFIIISINAMGHLINIFIRHKPELTKDSKDIKIELVINDEDYEMINKKDIKDFNINLFNNDFKMFDNIVKQENEKNSKRKHANIKNTKDSFDIVSLRNYLIYMPHVYMPSMLNHSYHKDSIEENYSTVDPTNEQYNVKRNNITNASDENERKNYNLLNIISELVSLKREYNISSKEVLDTGISMTKSIFMEFAAEKRSYKILLERLCFITIFFLVIYLLFAVPLWCIKGWCSCCLCCKFFKPQQTIEAAKNYLLLNPPGILVTKKGIIIHYEPTEREKDCYEEFVHFITTL